MTLGRRMLWLVGLPLLLGASSYLLWHYWAAPAPLRHHFADAMWGFAVGAFVTLLWRDGPQRARRAWYVVGFAVCAGVELLQYAHVFPGTFDPMDLAAQLGAFVIAVWVSGGIDRWISANAVV